MRGMLFLSGLILPVAGGAGEPCLVGAWRAVSETARLPGTPSRTHLEIPGVVGMHSWRNMGEQTVDAPHRAEFKYVCRGDELALKKEGASYSLGYGYVGHYRRR